jgi:hypothetical protein
MPEANVRRGDTGIPDPTVDATSAPTNQRSPSPNRLTKRTSGEGIRASPTPQLTSPRPLPSDEPNARKRLRLFAEQRGGLVVVFQSRRKLELPHRLVGLPHAFGHLVHPLGKIGHVAAGHRPFGQGRDL